MRVLTRAAVLVALGAVAVMPHARAQSVVVGPLPATMSAIPGASITVPVVADLTSSGGASLGSVAARLTWRPGTLAYVSTSVGSLGSPTVNASSASSGVLEFAVANASGATGMPVLINVTFNVTGAPADTTTLGLSVTEITAAGSFADLMPITTATGARFCTSSGVWGDLDGDALFTAHDALIILTFAVGLPITPYSVVNGDVDSDGVVDSRDALIVLSAAVGIPVTQFRIGHIATGTCSLRSAASVQIQPRTPSVAPGDSLPVTAVVRDSTGALVQGVGLVWASKDATIVRAGPTGSLVAVAPGSTYATVFVQPGVKDSVPVVVTAVRHVWYVNPAVAAGNLGVEFGSQLYPFSTIDTAIVRAAADDTVRVAVGDYGPARIKQPLVMLGDSGAGGFPRLTSITTPALRVDSVPGVVAIRGFRLLNSFKGLVAKYVQTLELGSISVEGSRDLGIRIYGVDSLYFAHSGVVGAVGKGIELDSLRTMVLDHVRSDVIASASFDSVPPVGLRIAQAGTVSGDSLFVGTAGVRIDSVNAVALRRIRVTGSRGPALLANANSVSVVGGDFSGAGMFHGGMPSSWDPMSYAVTLNVGSSAVQFDSSRVHDNSLFGLSFAGGTTVSLRADTVARNYSGSVDDASSTFYGFGWLRLAGSAFLNNGPGYLDIEGVGTDSVTADSVVFDGTNAYVYYVRALRMHGGAVRNGLAPALGIETVSLIELDSVETSGNKVSGNVPMDAAVYIWYGDTATVTGMNAHDNEGAALSANSATVLRVVGGTMVNNAFRSYGPQRASLAAYYVPDIRVYALSVQDSADYGFYFVPPGNSRTVVDSSAFEGSYTLIGNSYCCSPNADTLIVTRTSLTGFRGTSQYGVFGEYLARLVVTQNFMDSLGSDGVQANSVDTTIASGNIIRAWGNTGLDLAYGVLTADSNVFVGCAPYEAAIYAWQPGTTTVAGNTLTGCGALLWVDGRYQASGSAIQVRSNTLTLDTTTTSGAAIFLDYGLGYVQVVGNTVLGGRDDGIVVNGQGYAIDSARVDSNSVQQVGGDGIALDGIGSPVSLTYNLIADNVGRGLWSGAPFAATFNTVVRNQASGVNDNTSGPSSFRYGNVVGNLPFGVVTIASSMLADSNWWGDINGPRCDTCSSTGDSVSTNVMFTPYDSSVAALAPPIPAPPGVRVFRPLAVRSLAVPGAPKAPQGVRRAEHAARTLQPTPRPAPRPVGRPTGRHRPAWKTGGSL